MALIAISAQAITLKDEYDDITASVNSRLPEILADDSVYEQTVDAVR